MLRSYIKFGDHGRSDKPLFPHPLWYTGIKTEVGGPVLMKPMDDPAQPHFTKQNGSQTCRVCFRKVERKKLGDHENQCCLCVHYAHRHYALADGTLGTVCNNTLIETAWGENDPNRAILYTVSGIPSLLKPSILGGLKRIIEYGESTCWSRHGTRPGHMGHIWLWGQTRFGEDSRGYESLKKDVIKFQVEVYEKAGRGHHACVSPYKLTACMYVRAYVRFGVLLAACMYVRACTCEHRNMYIDYTPSPPNHFAPPKSLYKIT